MKISVVTTLYCSAPYVEEFYQRMSKAVSEISLDYEIIFVNDGSPDNSLEVVVALHQRDGRVKIIDFSRNFGHHRAIMTGLAYAEGDIVFLIDSDLEEAPELIGLFFKEMGASGEIDVVYGVQKTRRDSLTDRIPANMFYWFINLFSDQKVPAHTMTVRLMTKRYVDNLIRHRDREIFLLGLFAMTGFRQKACAVDKLCKGVSTYTMRRKLANFFNALTSFTSKPLVNIFYMGMFISLISGCYIVYLLWLALFRGHLPSGYASMMVSLWFLSGLIIGCLGIIGIYLSKIFGEVKERPYVVIRRIYGKDSERARNLF